MALDISEIKDMIKADIQAVSQSQTTLDALASEAVSSNDAQGYLRVIEQLFFKGDQMDQILRSSNYLDVGQSLRIAASIDIPNFEHYRRILVLLSYYALWQHFQFGDMLEKAMAAPQLMRLIHTHDDIFGSLIEDEVTIAQIYLLLARWPMTLYERYNSLLDDSDWEIINQANSVCGDQPLDDAQASNLINTLKGLSYSILTKFTD